MKGYWLYTLMPETRMSAPDKFNQADNSQGFKVPSSEHKTYKIFL